MIYSISALVACLFLSTPVQGFQQHGAKPPMILGSSTSLFLTSDEILARARKAVGLPEIEPVPMVFDDDILPMFQSALLKLETRVKEGPGSLSILEVEELDMEVKAILDEMHQILTSDSQNLVRVMTAPLMSKHLLLLLLRPFLQSRNHHNNNSSNKHKLLLLHNQHPPLTLLPSSQQNLLWIFQWMRVLSMMVLVEWVKPKEP